MEVLTTDSVPLSGTFHFLTVDRTHAPGFVYAADTQRHVLRRKDVQTGGHTLPRVAPHASCPAEQVSCVLWAGPGMQGVWQQG